MRIAKPPLRVLLAAHLRADPRKSAVLVVLTLVLAVLYVRWLWPGAGPEQIEAAGIPAASPTGGQSPSRAGPGAAGPTPPRMLISTPLVRELTGDPFALDLQRYPAGREEPADRSQPPAPVMFEDPVEAAARTLTLQSTMCGPAPLACINGEFIKPGQRVNGFVLERVEPTRVVLERDGVKVELYLK